MNSRRRMCCPSEITRYHIAVRKVRILIPGRKVDDVSYRCEKCGGGGHPFRATRGLTPLARYARLRDASHQRVGHYRDYLQEMEITEQRTIAVGE